MQASLLRLQIHPHRQANLPCFYKKLTWLNEKDEYLFEELHVGAYWLLYSQKAIEHLNCNIRIFKPIKLHIYYLDQIGVTCCYA